MMNFLSEATVNMIVDEYFSFCQKSFEKMIKYKSTIEEEDIFFLKTVASSEIEKIEDCYNRLVHFLCGCTKEFDSEKLLRSKNVYVCDIKSVAGICDEENDAEL